MKKQFLILTLSGTLLLGACSTNPNMRDCSLFSCQRESCQTETTPAYFAFDSSLLSMEDKENLDEIAMRMKNNPDEKIIIKGFADDVGPNAYNKDLSERRAESAAKYLESQGISPNRITARGYGATHFAESNATPAGRAKNRRIEVSFSE